MAHLQLAAHQIRDLEIVRDIEPDRLQKAVEYLLRMERPPLTPAELLSQVKQALDGDNDHAESVMRQCLSFNGLMRQVGLDADDVVEGIRHSIQGDAKWSEGELARWNDIEAVFTELLCVDAFRIVATAIELSYEYANLYRKGRILTDIRPLFSKDAQAIDGAVISYTLRLRYDSVDGDHELSIAMDDSDVRELSKQCERALIKAQTARARMQDKADVSTIVTGE